jgi:hypothetical protein
MHIDGNYALTGLFFVVSEPTSWNRTWWLYHSCLKAVVPLLARCALVGNDQLRAQVKLSFLHRLDRGIEVEINDVISALDTSELNSGRSETDTKSILNYILLAAYNKHKSTPQFNPVAFFGKVSRLTT